MNDIYTGIGVVLAALGARDAIRLYIRRHEGCGRPNCVIAVNRIVGRYTTKDINSSVDIQDATEVRP